MSSSFSIVTVVVMGRMFIVMDDNVERRLRLASVALRGGKKGELSSVIEEAIEYWLKKHSGQMKRAVKRIS
ncbi:MAG TPA: hypothetical protein VJZ75_09300 [Candidatus Bathyarchaeia archaeon]|nr:hypothetical protein [Candidatus Bathyarchaeia archaeon]